MHAIHHNLCMTTFRLPLAPRSRWTPWLTGLIWFAAALSAGYWIWSFPSGPSLAKTALVDAPQGALGASADALPRILGATRVKEGLPSADDKSIQLLGVIAAPSGEGSALLAIDGQAPKPFRVGQVVIDGWTLEALTNRQARLASLGSQVTLNLPPLNKP